MWDSFKRKFRGRNLLKPQVLLLVSFTITFTLAFSPWWITFQSAAKQLLSGVQELILPPPECLSLFILFIYLQFSNGTNAPQLHSLIDLNGWDWQLGMSHWICCNAKNHSCSLWTVPSGSIVGFRWVVKPQLSHLFVPACVDSAVWCQFVSCQKGERRKGRGMPCHPRLWGCVFLLRHTV